MKQWEKALGRIRFLAPDIPEIRQPVKYLSQHITALEKTIKELQEQLDEMTPYIPHEIKIEQWPSYDC